MANGEITAEEIIEQALDDVYADLMGVMEEYPQLSRLPQRSLRERGLFRYDKNVDSKTLKERPLSFATSAHDKALMAAADCDITIKVHFPAEKYKHEEPAHGRPIVDKKIREGRLKIWTEVLAADTDQARHFRSKVDRMIRGRMETLKRSLDAL
jgi:hypothetical protein